MYRIFLFCLAFIPQFAYGDLSFEKLGEVVQMPESLEGGFSQEKYLAALETSLVSSGEFSYRKGQSVRWETLTPIKSKLTLTPDSVNDESGVMSAPGAGVFSRVLFSVLTADWNSLSVYFDISGDVAGENWQVTLKPHDATIATVVRRIELGGDALLRELVLHDQSGDFTKIIFDYRGP